MKFARWTRLKAYWPEYILIPILAVSVLELVSLSQYLPLVGLHRILGLELTRALLFASVCYIASHILRAARLSLLLGVGKLPFGAILGCHSLISFVTFAMPFKLGEIARAIEFYRLTGSSPRAILSIWLERCFDAVIVLGLIEIASASMPDMAVAPLTRRGLLLVLSLSLFIVLFGHSALAALLRLLSASTSSRSLTLMRHVRRLQGFVRHLPPLTSANLALLFIVTCGIWLLELLAIMIISTALNGWQHGAVSALVGLLANAVTGGGFSSTMSLLLYRLLVMGSLLVIAVLTTKFYLEARFSAWPRVDRARRYRFAPRTIFIPDEKNTRLR